MADEESGTETQPAKGELTLPETERLLPHAIDYLTQADWDQAERRLAIALATHQVINENAERINRLARKLLLAKQQKESPE